MRYNGSNRGQSTASRLLLILAFLSISAAARAQPGFSDRLYFGGNVGFSFGRVTFAEVSPIVGYKITEKLSAGTGVTYIYFKSGDFSTHIYGGRLFARYLISQSVFAHVEDELLSREIIDFKGERRRIDLNSVLVGGGFRQNISGRSFATIMVLFNLTPSIYSPYTNPIIRIGFNFGY
jgi:hypothetical protein